VTSNARNEEMDRIVGGSYVDPESTCITPLPSISRSFTEWERRTDFGNDDVIRMKFIDEPS
jgi:hypothetical protein